MKSGKRFIPPALLGILLISLIAVSPALSDAGAVRFYDPSSPSDDQVWARQGGQIGLEVSDSDLDAIAKMEGPTAERHTLGGVRTFHLTKVPVADRNGDGFVNERDITVEDEGGNPLDVDRARIDGRVDLISPYTGTVYVSYWAADFDDTGDRVRVKSRADPTGFAVTLKETKADSGVFRLLLDTNARRSHENSSPPSLKVGKNDVITLAYRDQDPSRNVSASLNVETTPPFFSNISPPHNSSDRAEPEVEFEVRDSGSGIEDEGDIWVILAIDSDSDGVVGSAYEYAVHDAPRGDVYRMGDAFNVRQGFPNEIEVDSDATIYWWALARDSAGNLAVLDRRPRIDGGADPCYVDDFRQVSLGGANLDRTHAVAGCQPYVTRIDNTGPRVVRVTTGRWWDTSKDGDDKTEYDPTKARNDSILVAFSEDLDPSTVQRSDFRVDGAIPLEAEVFSGREDYVFLTVPPLAAGARPGVEALDGIFDPAGNRLGSGTDDDEEEVEPTPTPERGPFELLVAVLRESEEIGAFSEDLGELLADLFIEHLIVPTTEETPGEAETRILASDSALSGDSLEYLIAVADDARRLEALSDTLADLLTELLIEYLIIPVTGEAVDEARGRLSVG